MIRSRRSAAPAVAAAAERDAVEAGRDLRGRLCARGGRRRRRGRRDAPRTAARTGPRTLARSSARLTSVAAIAARTWSRSSTSTALSALVASMTSDEETGTPASRSLVTSRSSGSRSSAAAGGVELIARSSIGRVRSGTTGRPAGPSDAPSRLPETMTPFDPTRAPAGRLARLGVVVDPAEPSAASHRPVRDLAGIDIVWIGTLGPTRTRRAGRYRGRSRRRFAGAARGDRGHDAGASRRPPRRSRSTRARRTLADRPATRGADDDRRTAPASGSARSPSRRPGYRALLAVVDDIVLPAWRFPDLETAADEARAEAARGRPRPGHPRRRAHSCPCRSAGRARRRRPGPTATRGSRALGHPRDVGIFGTLEECQDRVIALAHAGISDLRCILPAAPDVHDVIAQLTAVDDRHDRRPRAGLAAIAGAASPRGLGRPPGAAAASGRQRRLPAARSEPLGLCGVAGLLLRLVEEPEVEPVDDVPQVDGDEPLPRIRARGWS